MPRSKAPVDPKLVKLALKDAKAAAAAAKKAVTEAQAALLTDFSTAKAYRATVSDHIAAIKALNTAQEKADLLAFAA